MPSIVYGSVSAIEGSIFAREYRAEGCEISVERVDLAAIESRDGIVTT